MLVYHPAFDAYHCVFRLLAILEDWPSLENDRLRILDFVLCFPAVVAEFKLPPKAVGIKRVAKLAGNAYRTPLNPKATFGMLSVSQDGALSCLAAASLIAPNNLRDGAAARTVLPMPDGLKLQCATLKERERLFFQQMLPLLLDIPLFGPDGLKARSGLIEHRYDTVQT